MSQLFFQITNTVALLAWIALLLFPARRVVSGIACAIVVPALLAGCYAAVIAWKLTEQGLPKENLTTIAGLRALFADDWVLAAAWTHYLVFDMVVGAWIARDAVRLGIAWPLRSLALLLTFLAGPVGFLIHLACRLPRASVLAMDDGG